MSVQQRIRDAAALTGLNLKDFSDRAGISYRTVQNYVSGERGVGADFLTAISERLGVSSTWILTGLGDPLITEKHSNGVVQVSGGTEFAAIPRYSVTASAGHGAAVASEEPHAFFAVERAWLSRRGLSPDGLSVIAVRGDSMEPILAEGELIMIDASQTAPRDSGIYVVSFSGDLFVKRIQQLPGDRIQLLSANQAYPAIIADPSDADQVRVIGRVIASMRAW